MKTLERSELTYDGFGINGPDEYRSRIATFTNHEYGDKYGHLLASAPALLEALQDLEDALTHSGPCQCCQGSNDEGHEDNCRVLKARAAIRKATQ